MAGAGGSRGAGIRGSRAHLRLAAGRSGAVDPGTPARSMAALFRSARDGRQEVRGGAMNLLQELEAEQVTKLAGERPVPPFQPGDTGPATVRPVAARRGPLPPS